MSELEALRARVAELEQRQTWQPISTASHTTMRCVLVTDATRDEPYPAYWDRFAGGWRDDAFGALCTPTHWMALPAMPAKEQAA